MERPPHWHERSGEMEIKIGNKVYPLSFGIEFLRQMDKRYEVKKDGMPLGMGLSMATMKIGYGDPVAMYDVIMSATSTLQQQPSRAAVENFLFSDSTSLEELSANFMSAFNESKAITKTLENIARIVEKGRELEDQEIEIIETEQTEEEGESQAVMNTTDSSQTGSGISAE